ncbi:ATP-binding cassette domain-containing protein [Bifidobacterium sp. LC6]|uniref:ATP-binding cassette domain-containing protein n=1 Tax=Bifidobacterium colobi TaxID=2809026 RepID=A0ABS5UV64_9BIFI|nr:ATP-binding cassette domain-containing protein [Bifidobacterium colobi]MBT1174929.1 ATP-binding cassette domain-containing protein [Bifidobacterium colobi]
MGFFFKSKALPRPQSLTFRLDQAGHTYDDGQLGLAPTTLTISEQRVAVIGLNGAGKSTLLGLLDGTLKATAGTVHVEGGEERLDPSVKKDAKRINDLVGIVRREEIPNAFYRAKNISEAVSEALKKHKIAEGERQARIGNLFAHFDLAQVARAKASELDSLKRHMLAIAAALSFEPSVIVADEPSKGLDEIGTAQVAKALFSYDKQVIIATHDTDMICKPEYAIDRALVLDEHTVVFDGTPHDAVAFYEDLIRRKYEAAKKGN